MDYYAQLRDTIQGAPQQTAGLPILGGPAELSKYNDINFQLPLSNAGISALGAQTGTENTIKENSIKSQISANNKKMSGEGYQRLPKDDGGYTFLDPDGNEISAFQYARATGKNSAEVLADSENPIDVQYQNDYNGLQDFLNASTTGDKATMDAYYAENSSLRTMSPAEVMRKFKEAYPTVYGTRNVGQKLGSTYIPTSTAIENTLSGFGDSGIGE